MITATTTTVAITPANFERDVDELPDVVSAAPAVGPKSGSNSAGAGYAGPLPVKSDAKGRFPHNVCLQPGEAHHGSGPRSTGVRHPHVDPDVMG